MFNIIKLPLLCFILIVLQGCATIEYYEFLEPQRSAHQQFIDTPYVYSGLVETGVQTHQFQFSGVLYDTDNKILDINIATNIATNVANKEHHNVVELSNSDFERALGEPALLVVNPNYPFNLDAIKAQPDAFAQKYYLQYQPHQPSTCPHIVLLNIDIYEELPTTLEFALCQSASANVDKAKNSYVWQTINADDISNKVEHDKMFGHQVGYLGFLVTVPFDVIVAPLYTLGWGLVASKNLLFSGEE